MLLQFTVWCSRQFTQLQTIAYRYDTHSHTVYSLSVVPYSHALSPLGLLSLHTISNFLNPEEAQSAGSGYSILTSGDLPRYRKYSESNATA
jgi:hypothetical protein